jgi:hypothetical protein
MTTRPLSFITAICMPLLLQLVASSAQATTTGRAVCNLSLEGYGNRRGLKSAQLSCTGGNITAAADPLLLQSLGTRSNPSGVVWSRKPGACEDGDENLKCLFSICGGDAMFVNPRVTNVTASPATGGTAICILGGSVTLHNGTFVHGSGMRPVRIGAPGRTPLGYISNCYFADNKLTSTQVQQCGGALHVLNRAQASIWSSRLAGNAADTGGAICASTVAGVTLEKGCPTSWGAGAATTPRNLNPLHSMTQRLQTHSMDSTPKSLGLLYMQLPPCLP